jgi:hypothetical protein
VTDFSKILENAKKMQSKMKESQDKIKALELEGYAAGGSVKVMLNGEGEMIKLFISPETLKESKEIIEDLIIAAHNDAKQKIKLKTSEELSKITGGVILPPGFKFPF